MNYFVKRLLLFVPSLLLISVVVFILTKISPGSPLLNQFSAENLDYKQEQKEIQALRKAYKLDLPLFYFSVYRASSTDTLYKIHNSKTRENLKALAYEIADWKSINNFYATVKKEMARSQKQSQQLALRELLQFAETTNLKHFFKKHENEYKDLKTVKAAITSITNTDNQAFKNYFFKVKWNGINNQYHHWLSNFIKGDFGNSYVDQSSVSTKVFEAMKWTVLLSLLSVLFSYLIAVPTAIYAAAHENSLLDRLFSNSFFALYAVPSFWLASLCIIFLTSETYFPLFPSYGLGEVPSDASFFEILYIRISHLFLPLLIWTYGAFAFIFRQLRFSLLEQMRSDYYLAAAAKGISKNSLLLKHALRNALLPMISLFGSLFPALISGSFVIEYLFSIPGMGKLSIDSFLSRDFPVIYSTLLIAATLTLLGNLIADILYQWADPRLNIAKKSDDK